MYHLLGLVGSIILGVFGQLLLKAGALQGSSSGGVLYFQKATLLGLFIYFTAALLYIFALQKIPLSIAFPSVSISYVVVAYVAHLIWDEPFGPRQIAALLFICLGILTMARQ